MTRHHTSTAPALRALALLVAALLTSAAAPPPACARDANAPAAGAPATFDEALARIDAAQRRIDALVAGGAVDEARAEARAAAGVARTLVTLAMEGGSGVPREAVLDIRVIARDLATKLDSIDQTLAAGANDQAKALSAVVAELTKAPGRVIAAVANRSRPRADADEPYRVEFIWVPHPIHAGEEVAMQFIVRGPDGAEVDQFDPIDTELLHVAMVAEDLSWMALTHPALRPNKRFTIAATLPDPGQYIFFCTFKPKGASERTLSFPVKVAGAPPAAPPLSPDADTPKRIGDLTVALRAEPPPRAGEPTVLTFACTRAGAPVTEFEPYLGARGQLVVLDHPALACLHAHTEPGPGDPSFRITFPHSGVYKLWGLFRRQGEVLTVPFVLDVAAAGVDSPAGR